MNVYRSQRVIPNTHVTSRSLLRTVEPFPRVLFPHSRHPSKKPPEGGCIICMERMMGIEPTLSAWKAEVLPLNYIRM